MIANTLIIVCTVLDIGAAFMAPRDPLDEYSELLKREAEEYDADLAGVESSAAMPSYLKSEAFHYEADRQRYEADMESAEKARESREIG